MYKVSELLTMRENQIFDRKSIKIEPKTLSDAIVAFANADGGLIVVGIDDKIGIEGINGYENKVNEILRVPFDFCKPSVKVDFERLDCIDRKGGQNRLLMINVHRSAYVHANQADVVFYRVGDKSKKLNFDERMQLMYDKGDMFYEDSPVKNAGLDDIDMDLVSAYAKLIDYQKSPRDLLVAGKGFVSKAGTDYVISASAILLFGKNPQKFFPRARIRFIKYEGVEEKIGPAMNIIKDIIFEGTVLQSLQKTIEFVGTQIREYTRLTKGGLFATTPEYPEFVWNEILVNAAAHRDYGIKGTDIQVKMFEDRITVESPGTLPGLVRLNNIRSVHFSRNPKIATLLKDYKYVKEFGEGVDRIYSEMTEMGLPEPEYKTVSFMTSVTVKNGTITDRMIYGGIDEDIKERNEVNEMENGGINEGSGGINEENGGINEENGGINEENGGINEENGGINENEKTILNLILKNNDLTIAQIAEILDCSLRTAERIISSLRNKNLLERVGSNKTGYWKVRG
jgi:ATP-dependent DNA helicase RecG